MRLRVHQFSSCSTANGPGSRAVIWVQGCPLDCPNCFNPKTHASDLGQEVDPIALARRVNALPVRGVTLSGGEPLYQSKAVSELLSALHVDKDVLLYSGYSLAEAIKSVAMRAVLLRCDAALMGRYHHRTNHPFDNKELIIRTGRIRPDEMRPHRIVELILDGQEGLITGFPSR